MRRRAGEDRPSPARRRGFAPNYEARAYLPVVVLEDEELPVPVLEELLPEAGGVVDDGVVPMLPELGGVLLLLELLPVDGVVLVEGVPLVLELPIDPLLELGVELVSVDELEEDEAGGVGGVAVLVLLLLVAGGGATTVVLSLRSHPAIPAASASAKALVNNILDFMGNSFRVMQWENQKGRRRPPFPVTTLASSMPLPSAPSRCRASGAPHWLPLRTRSLKKLPPA